MNKTTLSTAIIAAMGGISMSAQAALSSTASLNFDAGNAVVTGCLAGSIGTDGNCTLGTALNVTDMAGSFFSMDTNGDGTVQNSEKNAISQFAAIQLGAANTAVATGAHTGAPNGSESPAIDNPWNFNGNTGMHFLNTGPTIASDDGAGNIDLNMSGWGVTWGVAGQIPMGGIGNMVCSTAACADGDGYTLDMAVHVPVAFVSVPYTIHLEGTVSAVPVPAAAWLFGSGVVGLAGVARRRRNKA